jgi:hypothetical protein
VEVHKRRESDLTLTGWSPGAAAAWKQRWESHGGAPLIQAALPGRDEALPGEWVLSAKVASELGPHADPLTYANARLDEACKLRRDPAAWRRLAQRVAWVQAVSDRPVRPWWPTPEGGEGYPFAPDEDGLWISDNDLFECLRAQHLRGVLSSTAARRHDDLSEGDFWLDGDGVCALYAETFGLGLPEYTILEEGVAREVSLADVATRARQLRDGLEEGRGWSAIQHVAERIGVPPTVVLDRVRLATFAVAAAFGGWSDEDGLEEAVTLARRCAWPLGEALRGAQIGDLEGADLDFLASPSSMFGHLIRCDFSFADFSNCAFIDTRFTLCDLERASFAGCSLNDAAFHQCNLADADFRGADLSGVTFTQCSGLEIASWDDVTGLVHWEPAARAEATAPPPEARFAWSASAGTVEVFVPPAV